MVLRWNWIPSNFRHWCWDCHGNAQLMQRVEMLYRQVDTLGKTVETMGKTIETMGKKINRNQAVIERLTHEIAQLKRLKFAKRSEQMNPEQASLLDDLIDTDIAAIEAELQALQAVPAASEKKLALRRLVTQWKTGGGDHEFDPVCAAQWS